MTTSEQIDLVEAAIAGIGNRGGVSSYTINGRSIQYMTPEQLIALKKDLYKQLAAEKGGARNYAKFVKP